ncbi:MAG: hypothetical protein KF858_05925 [Candidatus Sumerlaeia bacterium]|nr:hypothetical protein [Candidatus Sumerlaeia bacterium]
MTHHRFGWRRETALALGGLLLAAGAQADVTDLRITEVDVHGSPQRIEVTNTGASSVTLAGTLHFCHQFQYSTTIGSGTSWTPGEAKVFEVNSIEPLGVASSDLWLYANSSFEDGNNIIHGLKWGTTSAVGRVPEATTAGKWPSHGAHVAAPPSGTTIAWRGSGAGPAAWYIDATPSIAPPAFPDNVGGTPEANAIAWPGGTQTFEGAQLGSSLGDAAAGWFAVGAEPDFTIRAVNDVQGAVTPRGSSTQWLRVIDEVSTGQQRWYSPTVDSGGTANYEWSFWVYLESDMPSGVSDTKPRVTIQHDTTGSGGFANAWGIEFAGTGAGIANVNLIVIGPTGGTTASATLGTVGTGTSGEWLRVRLAIDFTANTATGEILSGGTPGSSNPDSLPINYTGTPGLFRFCYRGETDGNVATYLIDDITLSSGSSAVADWTVYR